MPRSSGGRILAEIRVGGHGCWNIVNDENQNWWCQVFFDPSHRIRILLRPAFLKSNGPVCVERPSKADCLTKDTSANKKYRTYKIRGIIR